MSQQQWGYRPPGYPPPQGGHPPQGGYPPQGGFPHQGYQQGYGQGYQQPGYGHQQPGEPSRYDGKFWAGLVCTVLGCLIGIIVLVKSFVIDIPPEVRSAYFASMGKATVVAYMPVALYLFIPYIVDRYDPEPIWALAGVFLWGALFATGISAIVNTRGGEIVGELTDSKLTAQVYGTAISAPVFEELTKGLAIVGMVTFLRREFDGVVDGIIYATFVAIGFAATENIIYYTRADLGMFGPKTDLKELFKLRGILTPWLHPLFTSMTGIGFGLARVSTEGWKKVLYPIAGYFMAVLLHAWWNGLPMLSGLVFADNMRDFVEVIEKVQLINMIVGILMALSFLAMLCFLVYRKGQTIKKYLQDELLIGTMSQEEYDLITSYGGRLKARLSWRGKAGADFVAAGARLALSKYHTARAMKGQKRTISADFIVPLRQELARQRQLMMARAR
jgi:RsiW-degrading membrane proteinase PrsW (M82 family)